MLLTSGAPSQEKSEGSTSTTLQQPQQQFIPQQQGGAQQGDKGQSSNMIKRPGGPAQAISFGTLMPVLLPILQPDKAQKLNALYLRLKVWSPLYPVVLPCGTLRPFFL